MINWIVNIVICTYLSHSNNANAYLGMQPISLQGLNLLSGVIKKNYFHTEQKQKTVKGTPLVKVQLI